MKKLITYLFIKFTGLKTPIQKKQYPYQTTYGELSVEQAQSISHYMWFDWHIQYVFSCSTKVIVNKSIKSNYFEGFKITISEFCTLEINP